MYQLSLQLRQQPAQKVCDCCVGCGMLSRLATAAASILEWFMPIHANNSTAPFHCNKYLLMPQLNTNRAVPSKLYLHTRHTTPDAGSSASKLPNVVQTLRERGLVQEVTSEQLQQLTLSQSVPVYCGFDPTADSLHLGNLLGIIVLSWFQRCGRWWFPAAPSPLSKLCAWPPCLDSFESFPRSHML